MTGTVAVTINNMKSACADHTSHCAFKFTSNATPEVKHLVVTNTTGQWVANVTGHDLQPPLRVWFGTVPADNTTLVMADSNSVSLYKSFRVTVPAQTAGVSSVFVHTATGNADHAWQLTCFNQLEVRRVVTKYAALTAGTGVVSGGSTAGGDRVTLVGRGFSPTLLRNVVSFGTVEGVVVAANFTSLTVLTPPPAAAVTTTLTVGLTVAVLDPWLKVTVDTVILPAAYTYASALSPYISTVHPTAVQAGTPLTITGRNFGDDEMPFNSVTIGLTKCAVTYWNATGVACTVGSTPAGTHKVLLTAGNAGLAVARTTTANVVTVGLTVTTPTAVAVGPGGGAEVTLTGSGFAPLGSASTNIVTVCGVNTTVVGATPTSLTFLTPTLQTAAANDQYNTYESEVLRSASTTCTGTRCTEGTVFDGQTNTEFIACTATMDLGPWAVAVVTKLRFFPKFNDYTPFKGSTFQAATTAGFLTNTWTTLYQVSGNVLDGWNYRQLVVPAAAIASLPKYRYLKVHYNTTTENYANTSEKMTTLDACISSVYGDCV